MIKTALGILAAIVAVLLYMSYFVVDEKHKALVLRSATSTAWWNEPGLYFKLPFADTVTLVEDRIIIWENNDRPVQDVVSRRSISPTPSRSPASRDARLFRETPSADPPQAEAPRRPASMPRCARPMAASPSDAALLL